MESNEQVSPATKSYFGTATRWVGGKLKCLISWLETNGNLANAIATILSAFIAFVALFASLVSVYLAREALKDQHHHNVLSVKPLPMLTVFDGEEKIQVVLRNNGSGPLIIKDIGVTDGKHEKTSVIEWMPELPDGIQWDTFASESRERSLAPGDEIVLVRLLGEPSDPAFREGRDKSRNALRNLTVSVRHTDIYGTSMVPHVMDLTWFGRRKKPDAASGKPH
ncbi:hypothetical protein SAMN05444166_0169 [Singulisphaera sp. GP187]|uniref:hypothetical protein n=1 Tax=Singulisphaera sp. GP187 TaxID=1882752 RepID=UPI0009268638|nr:hypothetical protein [Singulisphaera sp. GP187]SIN69356.1 hypothetical protein SAMN05444166_0169 [Singulisphaera sp. GP187]